jgi:hypothetical protein
MEGWLNLGFLVKLKSFVYPFIAGLKNSSNKKKKKKLLVFLFLLRELSNKSGCFIKHTSCNLTTFGCLRSFKVAISLLICSNYNN